MVVTGKDSVNSKPIQRLTGAKITIRDHELDPNLRNIKFDGTFDQIKQDTVMVRDLFSTLALGLVEVREGGTLVP